MKKRTKKLLHIGTRLFQHRGLISKSFLLLFFKKDVLAFLSATGIIEKFLDQHLVQTVESLVEALHFQAELALPLTVFLDDLGLGAGDEVGVLQLA